MLALNTATQQDPQEFSKLFIEQLEKLTSSNNNSPTNDNNSPTIHYYISGVESYCITCSKCHNKSVKENVFHDLDLNVNDLPFSVPIPEYNDQHTGTAYGTYSPMKICSNSVDGGVDDNKDKEFNQENTSTSNSNSNQLIDIILRNHYNVEELVGENQYACINCDQKQDASRSTSISQYPIVLFLQLMRYVYDFESGVKRKLMTEIQYPNELVLNKEIYHLVAVLYHKGKSAYSGHYVTEVMDWNTGDW